VEKRPTLDKRQGGNVLKGSFGAQGEKRLEKKKGSKNVPPSLLAEGRFDDAKGKHEAPRTKSGKR